MFITNATVFRLLDEWSKEAGDNSQIYYNYDATTNSVHIYSPRMGLVIGKAGHLAYKYIDAIKDAGVKNVILGEIHEARIPNYSS